MHWYLKEKGLPAYLGVKKYNTLGVNPAKFDAALVEVNNHKSDHYFKFIYRKPPENLIGKNLRIVGYSSSHRNPENPWDNTNKISTRDIKCEVIAVEDSVLFIDCATFPGVSGGAAIFNDGGVEYLVGVVSMGAAGDRARVSPLSNKPWILNQIN